MYDQQLDLFSSAGIQAERRLPQSMELRPTATAPDDQALIAAIPESNLADSIALATDAGRRAGAGVIRQYLGSGAYLTETIAVAGDFSDADTVVGILTFWQAVDLVRARMVKRAHGVPGVPGAPVTVRAICEAYLEYMEAHKKTAADSRYRLEAFVYPNLGDIDAETLTAEVVRKWLAHLAASAPRVRTKAGAKQQYRDHDTGDDESVRKRKTSANRTWGTLRAALNFAVAATRPVWTGSTPVTNIKATENSNIAFRLIKTSPNQVVRRPAMRL
jgi:hypothetical protein